MLDFHQKRKVRSVMYSRTTLVVLTIIVLIFLNSTLSVYKKKKISEEMMNISAQNVEELKMRNEDLKLKISRLETEPGIEEEIRSRFSVVKDKENMVVVVPDQSAEASTTTEKRGFWSKIKDLFK